MGQQGMPGATMNAAPPQAPQTAGVMTGVPTANAGVQTPGAPLVLADMPGLSGRRLRGTGDADANVAFMQQSPCDCQCDQQAALPALGTEVAFATPLGASPDYSVPGLPALPEFPMA